MKKVFSLVAVALLTVSVLFTACRDNAATTEGTEAPPATETPATDANAQPQTAAPAEGGSLTTPADTTGAQQAQ